MEPNDLQPAAASFLDDVLAGLCKPRKELPAKYFYDARGSELFEEITRLPEYYLTRTEIAILHDRAPEIATLLGRNVMIVELGSGSSTKVRLLLDRLEGRNAYMPVDLSRELLEGAAREIAESYPLLRVIPVYADYTKPFAIPHRDEYRTRVVFFPGSTIGNLHPEEARAFVAQTAELLDDGDAMIVGVDLKKDPAILHAAYNDAAGVTEEFNRNVLRRVNAELGADFDLDAFEPFAFYDAAKGRIEMHLRSLRDQMVTIGSASIPFRAGETIHTENSYKYGVEEFQELVRGTGLEPARVWTDAEGKFSVHYLERTDRGRPAPAGPRAASPAS